MKMPGIFLSIKNKSVLLELLISHYSKFTEPIYKKPSKELNSEVLKG